MSATLLLVGNGLCFLAGMAITSNLELLSVTLAIAGFASSCSSVFFLEDGP